MIRVDIARIMTIKITDKDRIRYHFHNYQNEKNPEKRLRILRIIKELKK